MPERKADAILLTVVVPAYNMESRLGKCLDSVVVPEVMDEVEVIVVNDGSTDGTLELARKYESSWPEYIRVIDKPNGNYGSCMNVALSMARGKYFRTLDADDWFREGCLADFVRELRETDADLLICEKIDYNEATGRETRVRIFPESPLRQDLPMEDEDSARLALRGRYKLGTMNVVYKTEVIRASGLVWPENAFYTDTLYVLWPLSRVRSVRFIPIPLYVYVIGRDGQSVSTATMRKNFESWRTVAEAALSEMVRLGDSRCPAYSLRQASLFGIFSGLYHDLLINGNRHSDVIREFDSRLKALPDIYAALDSVTVPGTKLRYIRDFRRRSHKLSLAQFLYRFKDVRLIRRLLGAG